MYITSEFSLKKKNRPRQLHFMNIARNRIKDCGRYLPEISDYIVMVHVLCTEAPADGYHLKCGHVGQATPWFWSSFTPVYACLHDDCNALFLSSIWLRRVKEADDMYRPGVKIHDASAHFREFWRAGTGNERRVNWQELHIWFVIKFAQRQRQVTAFLEACRVSV